MSKTTKTSVIAATSFVFLGLFLFAMAMSLNHWDFTKLSTTKYKTNTYQISDNFNNISIKADTADILFAISDDGICKVVCYEMEHAKHSAKVSDDTLTIHVMNELAWYEHIGITIGTPKITVYLPKTEYDSVEIKTSTGDILVENISVNALDLSVSTGHVTARTITCKNDLNALDM